MAASPLINLKANQQASPRSAFTQLMVTRASTLWFLITAALVAFGLGALHALEPGHQDNRRCLPGRIKGHHPSCGVAWRRRDSLAQRRSSLSAQLPYMPRTILFPSNLHSLVRASFRG